MAIGIRSGRNIIPSFQGRVVDGLSFMAWKNMSTPLSLPTRAAFLSSVFRCMVAGVALADLRPTHNNSSAGGVGRAPTALVVGLGGGALPMALRRMYPSLRVLTVELDPEMATIAQEHFGLVQSDHLKVMMNDTRRSHCVYTEGVYRCDT